MFPKGSSQNEIFSLLVIFHFPHSEYRRVKICFYSCRYQNQKFSLVSHSLCSCSTRFALMSFVSTRVALVLHSCPSCLTRVARVALVPHSFPSYRTYVVPVWHSCCKLDWICELLSFISRDNFEKIFKIFFVH